jgi:hypothetical protein
MSLKLSETFAHGDIADRPPDSEQPKHTQTQQPTHNYPHTRTAPPLAPVRDSPACP